MKELRKILHVEDDADIRTIAKLSLETIGGFDTLSCEDAMVAQTKISEYSPDLILMDVMMPEMDGPSLLKELRKNPLYADTPVIFMTAKAQSQEIQNYKNNHGVIGIIVKPFEPVSLSADIRELWNKYYE